MWTGHIGVNLVKVVLELWLEMQMGNVWLLFLDIYIPFASSALQMEAKAFRAGLLIMIHQGWSAVDIECDCATLVTKIALEKKDCSEIGRITDR